MDDKLGSVLDTTTRLFGYKGQKTFTFSYLTLIIVDT